MTDNVQTLEIAVKASLHTHTRCPSKPTQFQHNESNRLSVF